jgi:cobalt/nickel transport system ATP-binding protein
MLDGVFAPSRGSLRALVRDVAADADGQDTFSFQREVGLVFQDPDIQLFSATVLYDAARD